MIPKLSGNDKQNPGVAKFGIALEWGSRGLEFESRHSDQKSSWSISSGCFFLFQLQTNSRPLVAHPERFSRSEERVGASAACNAARSAALLRVRISTLGPKKQNEHQLVLLFSFPRVRDSKTSNATVRWTVADTSANTGIYLNFLLRLQKKMQTNLDTRTLLLSLQEN